MAVIERFAKAATPPRKPIKELIDELDPNKFWQIHRSTAVLPCVARSVSGARQARRCRPHEMRYHELRAARLFATDTIEVEENGMTVMTPNARTHESLDALASRYVDVAALPWAPTRFQGIEIKVLMEDKETGLLTALTRLAPGAVLPDHEHVQLEQTFVLEGSLVDAEGIATAGNYVWRPAGSRHQAHSPKGCIALSFFLKPNKFFDAP